ncbi:MAG: PilT/PilU family type 4a pilus ATPase [Dehalogenimonas sp.]|jgi:twitching motility protein PilT|uniref:PilT/PilU family type 4a pilus ATPase n=1 Tax=Candidatus Dehalogenimonas loeffleri TaxID=3127115 RepID=A0ABZ2J740_9CHLR|nr:PilT/PilU family type 4a pilus ATPase [Dehalogenimonas sp.]
MSVPLEKLLEFIVARNATDLHLTVPSVPVLRIDGELIPLPEIPPLTPEELETIFERITTDDQKTAFAKRRELDFTYSMSGIARFRVSAIRQRGSISLAIRPIPFKIPSIDEFELPQICKSLITKPRGLILITGAAGTGKSTTLAAMINHLNETVKRNIVTVEDPIEFLFPNKQCLIRQRDLGDDTISFATALVHNLRHDPDVLVIGEMRDLDTISTAITAAETGHLVIATLHTVDAAQTIDRVVDVFPPEQQRQIRYQVSQVLLAVLSQKLLHRLTGGRIAAFEIMLNNPVVSRLIRDEKVFDLQSNIEVSTKDGMRTMDQALASLIRHNVISRDEGILHATSPARLQQLLLPDYDPHR